MTILTIRLQRKAQSLYLIKKNSRNYAKRQYTFFNNQMDVNWFNVDFDNFDNTINEVYDFIDEYCDKNVYYSGNKK